MSIPGTRWSARAPRGAAVRRVLRLAGPGVSMAVFGLALWVLQDWLRMQSYRGLVAALAVMPWTALAQAAALAAAAYAVLTGYDLLGMRFIGRRVPPSSVAATAFTAGALGNNFGNTLVTGAAVRYWAYTAAGLLAAEITKVVLFCSGGFWLGFLGVGGVAFMADPVGLPEAMRWAGAPGRPRTMTAREPVGPVPVGVCVDDFGLDPAIDLAALRLAEQGRVPAISCMTRTPGWRARPDCR